MELTKEQYDIILKSFDRIEAKVDETNERVRRLENWKWFITGGVTILSILVVPLVIVFIEKGRL